MGLLCDLLYIIVDAIAALGALEFLSALGYLLVFLSIVCLLMYIIL